MIKYTFKNIHTGDLSIDYGYGHYYKNGFIILKDAKGKLGSLYNTLDYRLIGLADNGN